MKRKARKRIKELERRLEAAEARILALEARPVVFSVPPNKDNVLPFWDDGVRCGTYSNTTAHNPNTDTYVLRMEDQEKPVVDKL